MPTPRRKTLTIAAAATAALLLAAAALLLSTRHTLFRTTAPSPAIPPATTTITAPEVRPGDTQPPPRQDPALLTQPTPLDDPQLLAAFRALTTAPSSALPGFAENRDIETHPLTSLFTPLVQRGCWDAALDLLATQPDLPAKCRADILYAFYRSGPIPPAIFLAQLSRLSTITERDGMLEGFLRAREPGSTDSLWGPHADTATSPGRGRVEQIIRSRFALATALLDPANSPGGSCPLSHKERRTILIGLFSFTADPLYYLEEATQDDTGASFNIAFSSLDSLAPLLQPGEEARLREAFAVELCRTRPFDSWKMLASSPILAPDTVARQYNAMVEADREKAFSLFRHVTATQLDALHAALAPPHPIPTSWDPTDPALEFLIAESKDEHPILRLSSPSRREAVIDAFFQAALWLNDPVRARQWLDLMTNPYRRTWAESRLEKF